MWSYTYINISSWTDMWASHIPSKFDVGKLSCFSCEHVWVWGDTNTLVGGAYIFNLGLLPWEEALHHASMTQVIVFVTHVCRLDYVSFWKKMFFSITAGLTTQNEYVCYCMTLTATHLPGADEVNQNVMVACHYHTCCCERSLNCVSVAVQTFPWFVSVVFFCVF